MSATTAYYATGAGVGYPTVYAFAIEKDRDKWVGEYFGHEAITTEEAHRILSGIDYDLADSLAGGLGCYHDNGTGFSEIRARRIMTQVAQPQGICNPPVAV